MKQKARSETAFKDDMKEHAFCDTQPIPHAGAALPEGAIVPNKPTDEPRTAPYNMPTGFEWSDVDINCQMRDMKCMSCWPITMSRTTIVSFTLIILVTFSSGP